MIDKYRWCQIDHNLVASIAWAFQWPRRFPRLEIECGPEYLGKGIEYQEGGWGGAHEGSHGSVAGGSGQLMKWGGMGWFRQVTADWFTGVVTISCLQGRSDEVISLVGVAGWFVSWAARQALRIRMVDSVSFGISPTSFNLKKKRQN